jgi:hypothetical protein
METESKSGRENIFGIYALILNRKTEEIRNKTQE